MEQGCEGAQQRFVSCTSKEIVTANLPNYTHSLKHVTQTHTDPSKHTMHTQHTLTCWCWWLDGAAADKYVADEARGHPPINLLGGSVGCSLLGSNECLLGLL